MDRARFGLVKELFAQAVTLPPSEREAYVDSHCGEDAQVGLEVRDLLEHARAAATGFLESSPADRAGAAVLRIPGYEILEQLASGATGSVWRARQERPRRDVAIKVLRLDSVGLGQIARFQREAQFLAELDHPGIARVIETGVLEDGPLALPWIALEFVHGVTLGEHARSAHPGLTELLELHVQVCEAVEHAHRRGIVHRDLKPSNVMVDSDGRPRVIDFGIARASAALEEETLFLTRTGMLVGTLPFMAPEQARGERYLTPAADVYALGAILYQALTGELPVDIEDLDFLDAVHAVCSQAPLPARRLRPDLPRDLETILAKALEKDPLRRYASAGALGADLRRLLAHQPVLARRSTVVYRVQQMVRRNPALTMSVVGIVAALAIALGVALGSLKQKRIEAARSAGMLEAAVPILLRSASRLGFSEEDRADLLAMLAVVDDQIERNPQDPQMQLARANLLSQLAVLDQARNDSEAMQIHIDASRRILEGIDSDAQSDLDVRTALSVAYARTGEAAHAIGRFEERDAWYERALEHDLRLVNEHPGNGELLEDLGWSLERVARVHCESGREEEGICYCLWRLADAQLLVRADPRHWKFVYNLSSSLQFVSAYFLNHGDVALAHQHSLESLRQARIFLELEPRRRDALACLLFADRHAERIFRLRGDCAAARVLADEALDLAVQLILEDPSRPVHLELLAWAAGDCIDLETGADRAAMACGIEQLFEQIALGLEHKGRPKDAARVRDVARTLALEVPAHVVAAAAPSAQSVSEE